MFGSSNTKAVALTLLLDIWKSRHVDNKSLYQFYCTCTRGPKATSFSQPICAQHEQKVCVFRNTTQTLHCECLYISAGTLTGHHTLGK